MPASGVESFATRVVESEFVAKISSAYRLPDAGAARQKGPQVQVKAQWLRSTRLVHQHVDWRTQSAQSTQSTAQRRGVSSVESSGTEPPDRCLCARVGQDSPLAATAVRLSAACRRTQRQRG